MSFREFRAGLAAVFKQVNESGRSVFVGAHRKPEAVVMSLQQYEVLQAAADRQHAVAAALASVRAEGLEPSAADMELFLAVASGELSTDDLRHHILSRYRP